MIRIDADTTFITATTTSVLTTKVVENASAYCAHRFQLVVAAGTALVQIQASIDGTNWADLLDSKLTGVVLKQMAIVTGRFSHLRVVVQAASGWTGAVMVEQYGDATAVIL